MTISPIGFNPYIYNSNSVGSSSMEKIASIQEDVLSPSIDYSELISEETNSNPLRMGETKGFMDILSMQLQLGQNHAARIFHPAETGGTEAMTVEELAETGLDMDEPDVRKKTDTMDMELANEATGFRNVSDVTEGVKTTGTVWGAGENGASDMRNASTNKAGFNLFQINRAIHAYTV